MDPIFRGYIDRWRLTPDGSPVLTRTSRLLPVTWRARAAMLKIAVDSEEELGNALMAWWDGQGAPRVFAHEGKAILLERAPAGRTLADLVHRGRDDEASRIICTVIAQLHSPSNRSTPALNPLSVWFEELAPAAERHGGILSSSVATARSLLAAPCDVGALHGDIHHDNILHFGERGWLAIDPKGLMGERGFDYANLFCNPDHATATSREVFRRRVEIVVEAAGPDRMRLLKWILAWAGLSAAWLLKDGLPPETRLAVAELAASELNG